MTSTPEIVCFLPSSQSSKSAAVSPVTGRPSLPTTVTGISITVAAAVSRTAGDGGACPGDVAAQRIAAARTAPVRTGDAAVCMEASRLLRGSLPVSDYVPARAEPAHSPDRWRGEDAESRAMDDESVRRPRVPAPQRMIADE